MPYFENPTTGPFVALDGLMWLKKSSGTWSNGSQYELFDPTAAGWLLHTTISVQTATGWQIVEDAQVNDCGYAGYFNRAQTNLPSNVTITGTDELPHQTEPGSYGGPFRQVTVTLQAWVDPAQQAGGASPYTTYAQAAAASHAGSGVFVGQATFPVNVAGLDAAVNSVGMYMPAFIFQELPAFPATPTATARWTSTT